MTIGHGWDNGPCGAANRSPADAPIDATTGIAASAPSAHDETSVTKTIATNPPSPDSSFSRWLFGVISRPRYDNNGLRIGPRDRSGDRRSSASAHAAPTRR